MKHRTKTDQPENPGRRYALRRLAGAAISAYVVPEMVFLSAARAEDIESSAPSLVSAPSTVEPSAPAPSAPAPSAPTTTATTPSAPSPATGASSSAQSPSDSCHISGPSRSASLSISRSDLARSQEAIQAGYAQPLENIWGTFSRDYNGSVISIEFTGRRNNARYRFRAISALGRLETVTISAQTGEILRIVGC